MPGPPPGLPVTTRNTHTVPEHAVPPAVAARPGQNGSRALVLLGAFSPESEEGERFGQVDEPFGFLPLRRRQLLASILTIEQVSKPIIDGAGQAETTQILWKLKLDGNVLGHGASCSPRHLTMAAESASLVPEKRAFPALQS